MLYECYYEPGSKNFIVEELRILCIDGGIFAKHFATAALVLGQKFDYLLDIMSMGEERKRSADSGTVIETDREEDRERMF